MRPPEPYSRTRRDDSTSSRHLEAEKSLATYLDAYPRRVRLRRIKILVFPLLLNFN